LLPLKQRLLVNQRLIRQSPFDIPPKTLISSLPDFDTAFDVTYKDYSYINTNSFQGERTLLREFDKDVFNARLQGEMEPYRYGSYFIYEANNKTK